MKNLTLVVLIAVAAVPSISRAGVYTDDMTKCLVESTSKDDRLTLVRWMFAAMSQHPAVASLTTVSDGDIEKANASVGALFMKLLTKTCVEATRKAVRYEGAFAIQASFQALGQVATMDLFADPNVLKVMSGLEKHADPEKLAELSK